MKNGKWKAILSALMLMASGCSRAPKPYVISIDASLVGGISRHQEKLFRKYAEQAIDSISTYFDVPFTDTLYIFICESGAIQGGGKRIYITQNPPSGQSDIIHETTHAVLKSQESSFELEGLAVFMQLKYTTKKRHLEKRLANLKEFVNSHRDKIMPMRFLMENDSVFLYNRESVECGMGYAESGLFYQYLAEQYGRDKMREYYRRGQRQIEQTYGLPLDSLDAQWRRWVFNEEVSDTVRVF